MHRHMGTISHEATTRAKHGTGEIKPFLNKNTVIQQQHLTERVTITDLILRLDQSYLQYAVGQKPFVLFKKNEELQ